MATEPRGFQLGILPERKIDRRAVATGYSLIVLLAFILINVGVIFPDRIQFKQYHLTSLIPMPALRPEPEPIKVVKPAVEPQLVSEAPALETSELVRAPERQGAHAAPA